MPWQHMHSLLFQSTLPREERHMTVQLHPHRRRFQSTLPREERPSLYLLGAHLHNFNPRSHERSDSQQSELITMLRISIHAPTRGATRSRCRYCFPSINFNPRSHERSDKENKSKRRVLTYFNPRSHERSDSFFHPLFNPQSHFNPRSHERSDCM